ncbi:MAG: acyl-CoA dehydrogenase C-terminal domain-containing protein [Acidimicrobiia bacterium]
MVDYRPPMGDIRFVLTELADLEGICELDAFPSADPDLVFSAFDEAARFASEVVAPLNRVGDIQGSKLNDQGEVTTPDGFKEAYSQYVAAGWGGVPFPSEYGGHGMPRIVGLVVQEMFKSACLAFSLGPLLTIGAIEALLAHGTEEQRQLYLGKLISGEWMGTMNLTESHAGSDLGVINTKAIPADDGTYLISGTKIFITWGEHDLTENIVHTVLAKLPNAPAGTKGISMFLVPKFLPGPDGGLGKRNDIHCVSIEHKLGIHASPTCVMSYGEEGGATGYLIGEENDGMRNMFTMMNAARIGVGQEGVALTERAYQKALAFAQERRQGRALGSTSPDNSFIIEHPDVRRMLMTMKAYAEAMRALIYLAGASVDLAHDHPDPRVREHNEEFLALITPVCKAWCTDTGVEMTSVGLQVHGGMGYVEETGAAQFYRDSRITPIYEGTNGIQAVDLVGRKLGLRNGDVARDFLDRMAEAEVELSEVDGRFGDMSEALTDAIDALREATEWLIARSDHRDRLAGASPYLKMLGLTAGGWLMARSAAAAARKLRRGDDGAGFLEAKISTAEFYTGQLLPEVRGLLPAVQGGADALFAIEPKYLG